MADDIGLRELMQIKFAHMETRFDDMKRTFEKAMEVTARADRVESVMLKVRELQVTFKHTDTRLDDIERRQNEAEGQNKIYRYIGGLVITIVMALVIAWLGGRLSV